MKKSTKFMLLVMIGLSSAIVFGQPPQSFNYQAVVRNNNGEIITNQSVGLQLNIRDINASGTVLYQENHSQSTNQFGILDLKIGEGTPTIGSFSAIDWRTNQKFVEVLIDISGGVNYVSMGSTELLSVPYALFSERSSDSFWNQNGDHIYFEDGNVGIGTTTPGAKLDIRGSYPDDGGVFRIGNSDLTHSLTLFGGRENDPNPFIHWKDGDPLRFATDLNGWSEKMRITSLGNVGIGTTVPNALLHTFGLDQGQGNVLFTGHLKHYDNNETPGDPPAEGGGTRMMWYPDKAALRVGNVNSDQWNKGNIGLFSMAMGGDTKAKGEYSTALGCGSTAIGDYSTAFGLNTYSQGEISFAAGANTDAVGYMSTAFGFNTKASSLLATAIGRYNVGGGSSGTWVETDPLFEIGNGVSDGSRRNAITVLKNGNLGIGSDVPLYRLEVRAPVTTSTGIAVFRNNVGENKLLIRQNSNGSGAMYLYKAGNELSLVLTGEGTNYINSGNLGIGTTSPSNARLQIQGSGNYDGILRLINTGTDGASFFMGTTNDQWGSGGTNKNRFIMGHGAPSSANVNLAINSDGYLGIGTIQPISILHVKGSGWPGGFAIIQSDAGNSTGIAMMNGLEGLWKISINPASNGLHISNTADHDAVFISQSRNVGIGTITPSSRLDVRGNVTIRDNATGDIAVELGTGLDYAEGFNVSNKDGIEAGIVLCIDSQNPGKLIISSREYDTRVAGIVAGANGLGSGISLGSEAHDFNVALAGRVYCWVDATDENVEVGDMLTTSSNPGHAMKANDRSRSHGAILGKAMESLEKGRKGQILVLVTLQ